MSLDALFADHSLKEYFPLIKRLHELNEGGVQGLGKYRKGFDSLLETTPQASAKLDYAWEHVLRFLVLDMLLRCKGYKASPGLVPDGTTIPKPVQSVSPPKSTRTFTLTPGASVDGKIVQMAEIHCGCHCAGESRRRHRSARLFDALGGSR